MNTLSVIPVVNLPKFKEGDDIVSILLEHLAHQQLTLERGDVLVLAQKIVSKVEGRQIPLSSVEPSNQAVQLAIETEKDPRLVELILQESTEVVRKKPGVLIVRHKLGHVGAHAGIDQSNIDHSDDGSALLLPIDPDRSAHDIRVKIEDQTGIEVGVIIADSANRPWRLGTVGVAIGCSNTEVLTDKRGTIDLFGRELKVTLSNRADAIAGAANLVMGETTEAIPIAIVRGTDNQSSEDTATIIHRPLEEDLFR
ncbi:MAG: coenzyme F420-0:L-glutamate ligase [Gammaproteobacteria bacterium]|nr:coenzyme F420-0:L-glutamate ligase [Gammaproteobacteria bacterium]